MKWWVFNEEQLAAALREYRARQTAEFKKLNDKFGVQGQTIVVTAGRDDINEFLNSAEAQAQNLRGDK